MSETRQAVCLFLLMAIAGASMTAAYRSVEAHVAAKNTLAIMKSIASEIEAIRHPTTGGEE